MKIRTSFVCSFAVLALACAASTASARQVTAARSSSVSDGSNYRDVRKTPSLAPADEYRMGPGDKIRVEVYKDAQLSQSAQVRPDGKITLPLVGDIEASNKTTDELRQTITTALKEYMTNPSVTVIVVEASAATAYVVGEVAHPGAVSLQNPVTVLQALALAGGLKDFANTKNIRVLRKNTTGMQTIGFNYKEAIKGNGPSMYLRPGDTIVVPD